MPSKPMTCSPSFDETTGEYGEPTVNETAPFSAYEDATDEVHPSMLADLQQIDHDYVEALMESNPEIPKALEYVSEAWTQDVIDHYDELIYSDSYEDVNKGIEMLLNAYHSRSDSAVESSDTPETSDELTSEQIDTMVLQEATDPSDAMAEQILNIPVSEDAAEATVQHLAYQYYAGQITSDQAYSEAASSGIDQQELYQAFTKLYNKFK